VTEVRAPSLNDQVVIVTGAARGIGRYIAHTFGRAGAKLVVATLIR
jgi:NAD(P)-dependent dehydrogenase (short-subunit alcohol dehydrogenase family)